MSDYYKDEEGKKYKYHTDFKNDRSNLVIISKDNVAFKTDKSLLASASPVFREMFSACSSASPHIHLDHNEEVLELFLHAINRRIVDLEWPTLEAYMGALDLCSMYDTPETGRNLLRMTPIDGRYLVDVESVEGEEEIGFILMTYCAKFDDVLTASRVISIYGEMQHHYTDGKDHFWNPEPRQPILMEKLPPKWVWAYMLALHDCDLKLKTQSESFWNDVGMRFSRNMMSRRGFGVKRRLSQTE
ncbi:hypothetical protein IAU59_001753 [Kwoniella sp. CBS 9459]